MRRFRLADPPRGGFDLSLIYPLPLFPQFPAGLRLLTGAMFALIASGVFLAGGCDRRQDGALGGAGRVRITYWEKWTGAESAAMQAVVDEFNAAQDRVWVDFVSMPQIDRKLIVATAGGNPPDLAGIWQQNITSFADRGALRSMDEFMRQDARASGVGGDAVDGFMARYVRVYADMCRSSGGRVYALPTTPSVVALHWNKALFREAGLDPERPPRTRAELDDFARRLTKRDPATGAITQAGFLPQEPGWWLWANPLWFGGSFLDGRGEISIGRDPANLESARWLRSYTEEYGNEALQRFSSGFGTFGTPQSAFFTGKVAMIWQGVWMNNYIRQFAPGLDYGVADWPAADEAALARAPFTVAESDVIVIPSGARHPEAAWAFVRYLSSANVAARSRAELRGMERLCFLQEKNSPLREWSPYFERDHPHPKITLFRRLSESPSAVYAPSLGVWQEYLRELNTANEKVRLLEASPEEAYAYVQARMEPRWRRNRESVARQARASAESRGPAKEEGAP